MTDQKEIDSRRSRSLFGMNLATDALLMSVPQALFDAKVIKPSQVKEILEQLPAPEGLELEPAAFTTWNVKIQKFMRYLSAPNESPWVH